MRFILLTFLLCLPQTVFAHAEHDKNRYVATDGVDSNRCDNAQSPCQSILYASQQANKGDKILLAAGQYNIGSDSELFYLVSQVTPIFGGYNRLDNYADQNPTVNVTTLTAIPKEFVEQLQQQGFNIVRDTKAQVNQLLAAKLSSFSALSETHQLTDCTQGMADDFPCENVSLVAHLPLSSFSGNHSAANDIWGHIDLNSGVEYAIIGLRSGTAVVSLAVPESPVVIGVIPGTSTTWRDIKVYQFYDQQQLQWQAYAYVTSDSTNEGITIIDLNNLPNQISLVKRQSVFASAHNLYISDVDYGLNIAAPGQVPLVHIAGANKYSGSHHSYSLSNPESLIEVLAPSNTNANDYSHDVSSLRLFDERQTTQCVNADDGCLLILDFNENSFKLWDQSISNSRVRLSDTTYNQASYVHSGWWSENKNYIFVHDELDEQSFGLNSTLRIFEITDLTSPQQVGTWTGPTRAIDHNGFVRGNRYYMSNYERGMTILDISNPANPTDIGFFDTFPASNNASFNGAWGVYPFLPSGLILVSDINSGLYVLRDHTVDNNHNVVAFSEATMAVTEGDSASLTITRSGDGSAALEVEYQILSGSANQADVTLSSGTINWQDNESDNKVINITTLQDQDDDEVDEIFFVRLFNPQSGTTLAAPNIATVTIVGKQLQPAASFTVNEIVALENQSSISVTVQRVRQTDSALQVSYSLISDTAIAGEDIQNVSGTINWPANDNTPFTIEIALLDDQEVENEEQLILALAADSAEQLASPHQVLIRIRDDESNQAPTVNAGADAQANTRQFVQLQASSSDAENDDLTIAWLQTAGTNVAMSNADTLTPSFTAPASASTLTFEITVTDPFGSSTTDTVSINVIAPTTPPNTQSSSSGGGGSSIVLLIMLGVLLSRKRFQPFS